MDYRALIQQFLDRKITAEGFVHAYLDAFKSDKTWLDDAMYAVLDELFGDADSYTTDPELLASNPSFSLDDASLRQKAARALERLTQLEKGP